MKATSASVMTRCRYRHDDVTSGSLAGRSAERKSDLRYSFFVVAVFFLPQAMRRQGGTA
jgi:hypothetical protein